MSENYELPDFTDDELEAALDAVDPADCPPTSDEQLKHMVRYATDPMYRALAVRCFEAERELRNVQAIGWLAWCGWKNRKSDLGSRMTRLVEACKAKKERGDQCPS